jgi:hypothetical protein
MNVRASPASVCLDYDRIAHLFLLVYRIETWVDTGMLQVKDSCLIFNVISNIKLYTIPVN